MSGVARRRSAAASALLALLPLAGAAHYSLTEEHARHDPVHALQQLDLLYLDEPAPGARELGLAPGRVSVVVVCAGPALEGRCPAPPLRTADVVRTQDPDLARAYGLSRRTGYALVDQDLRVRYRSVDPFLARHEEELRVLVRALQRQARAEQR